MAYLHCRFVYNLAVIENVFNGAETPELDIDFVTGDITLGTRYDSESYDFGTVNGSTLSVAAVSTDVSVTVVSTTGMSVGERISIELDNTLRFVSYIKALPGSGVIDLADAITSSAAIGNNAVTSAQLDTTTDGSLVEEFKSTKVREITNFSEDLLDEGFKYVGRTFPFIGVAQPELRSLRLLLDYKTDRTSTNLTITNITQANPAVVTVSAMNTIQTLDSIAIATVVGMTEVNSNLYVVGTVTGSTFELWQFPSYVNIDSSAFTAYTSGGICIKQEVDAFNPVLDSDDAGYVFSDNDDYIQYFRELTSRRVYIFGPSGQTGLVATVNASPNTQAAMDAIIDNR